MDLKEKILDSLNHVIDPETRLNVMRMKLVKDLLVSEGGIVSLTFIPSSPVCPLGFQLALSIQTAIKNVEGVDDISMNVEGFVRAEELKKILDENR